jgi:hypothetical protein
VLAGLILPTALARVPDVPLPPSPPRQSQYSDTWSIPAERIRKQVASGAPRAQAVSALAHELSIPDRATAAVLEALEIQHFLDTKVPMGAIRPLESGRLEAALRSALDVVPDAQPALDLLVRHACRQDGLLPDAARRLFDRTAPRTNPALLAVTAGYWCSMAAFSWDLHARALQLRPGQPALLHSLAEAASRHPERGSPTSLYALELALREATLASVLARPARSTRLGAGLATELLAAQLGAGRTAAAVAALDSLPDDVRAVVLSGDQAALVEPIYTLPIRVLLTDLRPALAAALALEGRASEAAAMVASVSMDERVLPRSPGPDEMIEFDRLEAGLARAKRWRLLEAFLSRAPADPFEAIVEAIDGRAEAAFGDGVWKRLLLVFATRHRMEAGRFAKAVCDEYRAIGSLDRARSEHVGPTCWRRALAIDAEIAEEGQAAERDLPPPPAAPSDRAARAIRAAIRCPFDVAQPLPEGVRASEPSGDELQRHFRAVEAAFTWPPGFDPMRFEARGDAVTAIGSFRGFDATGELPIHGYWIVQSSDGGRSWGAPLFTGHSSHAPYVVAPLSSVPLVDGDRLTIEVAAQPIAADSITFPPLFVQHERDVRGLVLRIPLAELTRDRDGDGLTDRIERALFTDPDDPDTDGDGQDDASDRLPQVPSANVAPSAEGTALAALVESWSGGRAMPWTRATRRDSPVSALFLVASRSSLRGVKMPRRVIVLEPEEAAALTRTTPFYPYEVSLLLFDRLQRRAVAIWDEHWRGGTVRMTRWFGRWHVSTLSEWIT